MSDDKPKKPPPILPQMPWPPHLGARVARESSIPPELRDELEASIDWGDLFPKSGKVVDPHAPTLPSMPAVKPAAKPPEPEEGEDSGPPTLRPNQLDADVPRQERVLVADDDVDIRELLSEILKEAGYQVRTAENGVDALNKITDSPPPDVVLCDIGMPKLSGKAVKAAMVADNIDIPVLIISAGDLSKIRREHPEWIGEYVFPKPLRLDDLLKKVELHIKAYRQRPRR